MICGVDEAGRGPILGPLVMCGVLIDESSQRKLSRLGVKDSKMLTKAKREELFPQIIDLCLKHFTIIIPPEEIDRAVGGTVMNLNWLEAEKTAEIINALEPLEVYVDCPSRNTAAYSQRLMSMLRTKPKLRAEHKADVKYKCVSAASIIAKVTRDNEVEKIKQKIGIDFGSGYLTDPLTQEFLKNHVLDFPEHFRKSWMPYKDLIIAKQQKTLGDF